MSTSEFTIDGRPWEYRNPNVSSGWMDSDPDDPDQGSIYRRPGHPDGRTAHSDSQKAGNPNAYSWTNPLYEYDKKTVKGAGRALGIQNVNRKEEVGDIVAYIKDQEKKEEKKDTPKKDPKPPAPTPPSEDEVKAEEFKNQKIAEIKERLAAPPIDIYEKYAGKDDLIARNAAQSEQSNVKSPDDDKTSSDKQKDDQDFLKDYIFKSKSKNQFVS